MKPIQVTFDERLLKALDADPEVKRYGRSFVLRKAAREYLRRKQPVSIAEAYRRGYVESGAPEFDDWAR
jgi:metal-responsive CopG/Arc/MetJ family transcriptional regulator